jgi:hypothetical protein
MAISKRVVERITTQLKRYQGVLSDAKNRDISESDTVVIIGDMLADVLGYKKYIEITTEFAIRGTYVDLAVKEGDDVRFLIEAKAIGVALKDAHVKQAIDYGANHGIEWVILTNGICWRIYKIHFRQPIDKSLVADLDLLQTSPRDPQMIECLGNLSREGFAHSSMTALYQRQQVTSKFSLASLLLSAPMIAALRKELRRVFPGIRVEDDFLHSALANEVLKRELVESEEAKQAADVLKKAVRSAARTKAKGESDVEPVELTQEPVAGLAPESNIIVEQP